MITTMSMTSVGTTGSYADDDVLSSRSGPNRVQAMRSWQRGGGNQTLLLEEWASQADLKKHMKSRSFRVLRGAMSLLKEQHEISFSTLFDPDER